MIDRTPLKDRARGRWRSILPSLGIDSVYLTGKHTACPVCRNGKDRFRFDDKEGAGTWICSFCGAGDGIKLVMLVRGSEFREAAKEIEGLIGDAPVETPRRQRSDHDKRRDMNAVWKSGKPVEAGGAVARYLLARSGVITPPPCIRQVERLRYFSDASSYHPAMIAMVVDATGIPCNIHRTYLTDAGTKAALDEPRRTMAGALPKGCAIRLAEHNGVLGVAEGIETALSVTALFGVPCWSLINTSIMSSWIAPPDVRELVIFADNDANFAGHAAAYALAHRVKCTNLPTRVEIPPIANDDWNNVHQQQRGNSDAGPSLQDPLRPEGPASGGTQYGSDGRVCGGDANWRAVPAADGIPRREGALAG